jgi:hypothetical protein
MRWKGLWLATDALDRNPLVGQSQFNGNVHALFQVGELDLFAAKGLFRWASPSPEAGYLHCHFQRA